MPVSKPDCNHRGLSREAFEREDLAVWQEYGEVWVGLTDLMDQQTALVLRPLNRLDLDDCSLGCVGQWIPAYSLRTQLGICPDMLALQCYETFQLPGCHRVKVRRETRRQLTFTLSDPPRLVGKGVCWSQEEGPAYSAYVDDDENDFGTSSITQHTDGPFVFGNLQTRPTSERK